MSENIYEFLINEIFYINYDKKYRTFFEFKEMFYEAKEKLDNKEFDNLLNDIFIILNMNNYIICKNIYNNYLNFKCNKNDINQINVIKFASYIYEYPQTSVGLIYDILIRYVI